MTYPVLVNDSTFETAVLRSPLPVLAVFCAPWCGPCQGATPILEKLAEAYEGQLLVAKINADENPEWTARYRISEIPTLLFLADGEVVREQVGAVPRRDLQQSVDRFLEITAKPAQPMGLRRLSPLWRDPLCPTNSATPNAPGGLRNWCHLDIQGFSPKQLEQAVTVTG